MCRLRTGDVRPGPTADAHETAEAEEVTRLSMSGTKYTRTTAVITIQGKLPPERSATRRSPRRHRQSRWPSELISETVSSTKFDIDVFALCHGE
jgi:hypothetical protein